MDADKLKAIKKKQEEFLELLGGYLLQIDDEPLSLKRGFEDIFSTINKMKASGGLSIPELILLIDRLISGCDYLKNKLIEVKWYIQSEHSDIYNQNKE